MRNLLTKVCFLCTLALFTAESLTISAETGIFPILAKNKKKKETKEEKTESEYKKLTGKDSVDIKGVANIIKKDGSYYLEFPTKHLGRAFLVSNKLQKVPHELNEAGVNKGINYENQVISFEWQKDIKKLNIRQERLTPQVQEDDAMAASVKDNYINPLIVSLKIEGVAPDSTSVIVKIDDLFNGKQTALNDVFNNINLGTSSNSDLSRILDIKAFDKNAEVSDTNPDHKEVKVAFQVSNKAQAKKVITNYAQIYKNTDKNGDPVDDIDSTPDLKANALVISLRNVFNTPTCNKKSRRKNISPDGD